MELHSLIPANHRKDTPIVAVSADPMDKIKGLIPIVTGKTGSEFMVTLLSDAQHRVIDQYGLRNETAAARGRFLPHPTTYVIDTTGRVRWKFTEKNYAVRPSDEVILQQLKKLW